MLLMDLSQHRYSYGAIKATCPARLELEAIKRCLYSGDSFPGGLTLAEHTKKFCKLAMPDFVWHRWNDMMIEEVSKGGTTPIWGPASAGKTAFAAVAPLLAWYWAVPDEFTGLCSTTDKERLELRVFGEVKMRFKEARERYPWLAGNLIDSRQRITTDAKDTEGRDFRNGILGIACKRGGEWQGLGDYAGIKNKFVVLIADEFHLMQETMSKGITNLKSNNNNGRFFFVPLGNLVDLETPLGQAAEPDCGWDAMPDSKVSRVYKTKAFNGRAIQLVGKDSPNFDFPAGQEPYPYLIGRNFIAELKHDCGEGSPEYIAQAGGLIPRVSLANRVITKEICQKFQAFEPVVWGNEKLEKLYAMDVSYTIEHGDRTCGAPFGFGKDIDGKLRLCFLEPPRVFSFYSTGPQTTVEEHIANEVKLELARLEIPDTHFFYDGTGRSSFTAAAMRVISIKVQPVEFGGRASERPNFIGRRYPRDHKDVRKRGELMPCSEVFDKFVTELWFATRYLIEADQMRDLPQDTARDGFQRLWTLVAGNKMSVESKKDMKKRLNRSPDLYDMFAVAVEAARRLGFVIGQGLGARNSRGAAWLGALGRDYREQVKAKELSYG
jgi:hypothetical protein